MRIGELQVALSTGYPRAELVELAIQTEKLGYGGLWLTEATGRDAFSLLTEIALKTDRIELGTGIVNHYSRSPSALAQAAASLSELLAGRTLNLGLGASSRAVIEGFHGLPFERPYRRMAETLQLIRLALTGERIDFSGELFRTARFTLGVRPAGPVRLYVAGFARPMLEVTGRYADGWLPNLPSRLGLASLRADVAAAADSADRPMPTTAAYLYTMIGEDLAEAEEPLRRTISWYLGSGGAGYRTLFRRYGHGKLVDELAELWQQGQREAARELVDSELIRDVALVGPASSVPEQLGRFAAAGLDLPVIRFPDPLPTEQQAGMLRAIAAALRAA